jgi:chaperonin cofactor prefoldin
LNATLQNLLNELEQVVSALNSLPSEEPFSIAHGNWSFPSLSKSDFVKKATDVAELIRLQGPDDLGTQEKILTDYIRRLSFLRGSTIPNLWSNAGAGASAFLQTIDGLSQALQPVLKSSSEISSELSKTAKSITSRLRALESRLSDAEPRTGKLAEMVERIEQAYQAADQLPADLQSLAEDRKMIAALLENAQIDCARIAQDQENAVRVVNELSDKRDEAKAVLERCDSAYSAATSQGLAAAFTERSKALATSMWVWTAAFVVALITGAAFGTQRVHEIGELLKNPAMTNWALGINLLLAALSVGAPIWFGWMATKQINQRFRLSEDYAFKAAVSRAYEGYRKEAARIDKDMEARLLASALTRLDEQPLRFVETENHGSPWHELASSDAVKAALSTIPGFADKMTEFARSAVQASTSTKAATNDAAKAATPAEADVPKTPA